MLPYNIVSGIPYMARPRLLLAFALVFFAYSSSVASAKIVKHTFHVGNLTISPLCDKQVITAVNGGLPGPTIEVHEGDTVIVHVFNESPYNITIHWHGVFQQRSGWADGPVYVTQCPILPGNNYTYKFNITEQEGTLWWHAHVSSLRATVYGAIIIRPRKGNHYPFPKPVKEFPILLGEWWNANVVDVEDEALAVFGSPNISNAFTINGLPGDNYTDLYNCSSIGIHKIKVKHGKTYLLRIINAALNEQLFFKIANHTFTVVAIDATYTDPMATDVIVIAPGQTVDALLTANQSRASYYMAARAYASAPLAPIDNTTTTAILQYEKSTSSTPVMPTLPDYSDTTTAHKFYSNLTSLVNARFWTPVPRKVNEHIFMTEGLGLIRCPTNKTCDGPAGFGFAASFNNVSLLLPTKLSMLQAFFSGKVNGIYTTNFPKNPPVVFDYTNANNSLNTSIIFTTKSTKVTKLKYNATVQIVFQNQAFLALENHPIHIHGFNFHVLAQGFGNYNATTASKTFNFVNPQMRNTIGVPVGGWAVIRFTANNPGVWFMHCHLDAHLAAGFASAFVVENGPTPETSLPSPPADLPHC